MLKTVIKIIKPSVFILAGITIIFVSLISFIQHEYRSINWYREYGDVYNVRVIDSTDDYAPTRYTAYFTYTVDGCEYKGLVYRGLTKYEEGDIVPIFYNPKNPQKYTTISTGSDFPKLLCAIGGGVIVYIFSKMLIKQINEIQDEKE